MQFGGWRTEPRWEWEKHQEIYVYGLGDVAQKDVERVVEIINNIIAELNLPLSTQNGNLAKSKDVLLIKQLIASCSEGNYINFDGVETELKKIRKADGLLPCGTVILVDYNKYKFKQLADSEQPAAIYGCGIPDGLIILRRFDIQNAVRHEFGHMIGLGVHHDNCVMAYACTCNEFCNNCQRRIKEIWKV